jgi:thioredoxin 1
MQSFIVKLIFPIEFGLLFIFFILILILYKTLNNREMALEVTDTSFAKDVLESGKPAMVDFWATWCGPCRMVAPTVEELAKEFEGQAVVAKVDVDNNQQIAAEYGIRNIPTILFFKDGQVVDKVVGVVPKAQLEQKLKAIMN